MADFCAALHLQVRKPDPEEPFAQMPGRAQLRRGIPRRPHILPPVKAEQHGEQPFAVRQEQFAAHNEHIAVIQPPPAHIFFRRRTVFGIVPLDDAEHGIEVFDVQNVRIFILPVRRADGILHGIRRKHVAPVQRAGYGGIVCQGKFAHSFRIEGNAAHNAVAVRRHRSKSEIPAVMPEPDVRRAAALPRPILSEQLAEFIRVRRHKAILFVPSFKVADHVCLHDRAHESALRTLAGFMAGNKDLYPFVHNRSSRNYLTKKRGVLQAVSPFRQKNVRATARRRGARRGDSFAFFRKIVYNISDNAAADVAKLADAPDLESGGQPCRFKSCHPHHTAQGSGKRFPVFLRTLLYKRDFNSACPRLNCSPRERSSR